MTTQYLPTVWTSHDTTLHGFGLLDSKGREIGAKVITWTYTVQYGPMTDDLSTSAGTGVRAASGPRSEKVGLYHAAYVHVTRDGKQFGASQQDAFFGTEAERAAYITRRLSDAKQRAVKATDNGKRHGALRSHFTDGTGR